jgi:hypothetical protein
MKIKELPVVSSERLIIYRDIGSDFETLYDGKFRELPSKYKDCKIIVLGVNRYSKCLEVEV